MKKIVMAIVASLFLASVASYAAEDAAKQKHRGKEKAMQNMEQINQERKARHEARKAKREEEKKEKLQSIQQKMDRKKLKN
jgi:hypothetical protein